MGYLGLYLKDTSQEQANEIRKTLNQLAKGQGFLAARGPSAGEGNFAELAAKLAAAYRRHPAHVIHYLSIVLSAKTPESQDA